MTTENMFERATRLKLRFTSSHGGLSCEQLWDVPLRSSDGFNLDEIAKGANKALKDLTEESFVNTERTPAHDKAELTLALVKHVIETRLDEEAAAKKRVQNRMEKEKLLKVLADKQEGKLSALSEKELQKKIAELD